MFSEQTGRKVLVAEVFSAWLFVTAEETCTSWLGAVFVYRHVYVHVMCQLVPLLSSTFLVDTLRVCLCVCVSKLFMTASRWKSAKSYFSQWPPPVDTHPPWSPRPHTPLFQTLKATLSLTLLPSFVPSLLCCHPLILPLPCCPTVSRKPLKNHFLLTLHDSAHVWASKRTRACVHMDTEQMFRCWRSTLSVNRRQSPPSFHESQKNSNS